MHPKNASRLDIWDGELVRLISRRGEITSRVKITDRSPRGMIVFTFHFKESSTNIPTNDAPDSTGKIPKYKVCAVRVEKTREGGV